MAVTWTTQRTGNWSLDSTNASSPWYDAGTQTGYARTPGSSANVNDDRVVIANGHTLTCDASVTVGEAPTPANAAIACASSTGTGILSVSTGVTLTIVSNVTQANATWTFAAGSALTFNSSTALTWQVAGGTGQGNAKLVMSGSTGSHVTVTSSGAAKGRFTNGSSASRAQMDCSYTDFTGIGDSSNAAITMSVTQNQADLFRFLNCTFTTCGGITTGASGIGAAVIINLDSCVFASTQTAYCFTTASFSSTTGTRVINNCTFDKSLGSTTAFQAFTITGNYITTLSATTSSTAPWAELSGNFITYTDTSGVTSVGLTGDTSESNDWNYLHIYNSSGSMGNPHALSPTARQSLTIAGWIFEPGNASTNGDIIIAPSPASSGPVTTVKYCLYLPIASGTNAGKHAGTAVSALGGANTSMSVTHCTWVCDADNGENGHVRAGETYAGHAGMFTAIKSNLAWSTTSGTASIFARFGHASDVSDICAAANADYNGLWNPITSGTVGVNGYKDYDGSPTNPMFSTTTGLGAHDVAVSADPFVDSTRNIGTWAVYKGQASSGDTYADKVTAAYAYLKTDPAVLIADLVAWVKAGFKVTDATLNNAGHDGVTIGALGYELAGNPYYIAGAMSGGMFTGG